VKTLGSSADRRTFLKLTIGTATIPAIGSVLTGSLNVAYAGSQVAYSATSIPSGKVSTAISADGTPISVHEYGNETGDPILLIHGWSQCYLSWYKQFTDPALTAKYRIVTMDVRGHGESGKPLPPLSSSNLSPAYSAASHAADIEAVVATLKLVKPVLVGWSFGGLVMMDYLSVKGLANVGGVVFVVSNMASTSAANPPNYFGPGVLNYFADLLSPNLTKSIPATINFLKAVPKHPFGADDFACALGYNMLMPSGPRAAIFARAKDDYDTLLMPKLKASGVKTLVVNGDQDTVILPAAAEAIANLTGGKRLVYDAGHAPFLEQPARFNTDLAEFVG
jgi:non-heme chloroperoxidase